MILVIKILFNLRNELKIEIIIFRDKIFIIKDIEYIEMIEYLKEYHNFG